MKITDISFDEIASGLYISDDKRGFLIDVFTFTGLDRSASNEEIAEELHKRLEANASRKIEGLIFDCGDHIGYNYKEITLDAERLHSSFTKLNWIMHGSDIKLENVNDENLDVSDVNTYEDLAFDAQEEGDMERVEHYYRWEAVIDYYWGNYRLGSFLFERGKEEEAEEYLKKVAGEKYIIGDGNFLYGHLLDKQGRYKEALKYLRLAMRPISDTAPREEAMCVICDSLRKYKENCPYWPLFDQKIFKKFSKYYLETCDPENGKMHLEKIVAMREKNSTRKK